MMILATTSWGERAEAFGWTNRDLFGLAAVPEKPAASYRRLSRYDMTGLIWLLRGRPVVALTEATAAIQGRSRPPEAAMTYDSHQSTQPRSRAHAANRRV